MGRIKQSRLNSSRMRSARRALGTDDLPPPRYAPGTRFIERHPPEVGKALKAEARKQRERLDETLAAARAEMKERGIEDATEIVPPGLHAAIEDGAQVLDAPDEP